MKINIKSNYLIKNLLLLKYQLQPCSIKFNRPFIQNYSPHHY